MSKQDEDRIYFGGYSKPNYTMVPDELFDHQLSYLSGSQLKVLLYILRRTFGFKKDTDSISLSQISGGIKTRDGRVLDRGTGLSRRHVVAAAKALVDMGIICCERRQSPEKGFESTVYSLNLSSELSDTLVTKGNQGASSQKTLGLGNEKELALVTKGNQQKRVLQETVEQKTDGHNSNIRNVEPGRKKQGSTARNRDSAVGPEVVGEILARSHGPRQAQQGTARAGAALRPEAEDEDFQRIQHVVMVCQRELGDRASTKSSTTRAWNLYQAAGGNITRFEQALYKARSLTQESTAQIKAVGDDPNFDVRRKIKMPYFFAVLEDILGLRQAPEKPAITTRPSTNPASKPRRRGEEGHGIVPHIET